MGRSGARPLLLCSPYSPPLSQSVSRDNDDDNDDDNGDDNDNDNDDNDRATLIRHFATRHGLVEAFLKVSSKTIHDF